MQGKQLRLVGGLDAREGAQEREKVGEMKKTAIERVFDHWVWMLGKNRSRTALGPTRRYVIEKALKLYDEETLLLAIEGCAACPWNAGDNPAGRSFTDLELILRGEAQIERFAEQAEALREQALVALAAAALGPAAPEPISVEAIQRGAEIRDKIRQLAAAAAGRLLR